MRNAYQGTDNKCETLLKVYERHNEDIEKMYLAGSRTRSTRDKYLNVYVLLKEFIRRRYNDPANTSPYLFGRAIRCR